MQDIDKNAFLKKLEMKKKSANIKSWMDTVAVEIIQVVSLVQQERELMGESFPKDNILFSILENASEELLVHFSVDPKTGELRPPLVGCV